MSLDRYGLGGQDVAALAHKRTVGVGTNPTFTTGPLLEVADGVCVARALPTSIETIYLQFLWR